MTSDKASQAVIEFNNGLLCSQSILVTYGVQYGLDRETAKRISRPFGSGMARQCETCGAVTGALMVLGMACADQKEPDAREEAYELSREFSRRFIEKNHSLNCQQLLDCDLGTPEGQQRFKDNDLIKLCQSYIWDAALILEEILA